jgi:hypothetical protein
MDIESFLDEIRRIAMDDLKRDGTLKPRALFYPIHRPPITFALDLKRKDHTIEVMNIILKVENPEFFITLLDTPVRRINGEIEHPRGLSDLFGRFESLKEEQGAKMAISLMMFLKDGRIISQIIPYEKSETGYEFDYGSELEMEFDENEERLGIRRW